MEVSGQLELPGMPPRADVLAAMRRHLEAAYGLAGALDLELSDPARARLLDLIDELRFLEATSKALGG